MSLKMEAIPTAMAAIHQRTIGAGTKSIRAIISSPRRARHAITKDRITAFARMAIVSAPVLASPA